MKVAITRKENMKYPGLVMLSGMIVGICGAAISAVVGFHLTMAVVVYLFGPGGEAFEAGALFLAAIAAIALALPGAIFFANLTRKILDRN